MKTSFKDSLFYKIINDKYFLYLIALITIIEFIRYIMNKNLIAIFVFYLFVFLMMYFTKNMSLILFISLLGTTIINVIYHNNNLSIIENFESKEDIKDTITSKSLPVSNKKVNNSTLPITKKKKDKELDISDEEEEEEDDEEEEPEKENYQNNLKLNPANFNFPTEKDLNKQLGKSNNIEAAYDNLEKIMGDNNIRSISNSTKELVAQQNELLKGLKTVTPALNEAMGALGKIDMNNLTSMFSKMNNNTN